MNLKRTEMGLQVLEGGEAPAADRELVPAEVLQDAPPWAIEFCRQVSASIQNALRARPPEAVEIFSTDGAMAYTGHRSRGAFYRWAAALAVVRSGEDRWPRSRLNRGLEKESRQGGRRKGGARP